MNISRNQRLISSRSAVDSDGLDDQALFLKESFIAAHQQWKCDVGNKGIATRIVSCVGAVRGMSTRTTANITEPSKGAIFIPAAPIVATSSRQKIKIRPTSYCSVFRK